MSGTGNLETAGVRKSLLAAAKTRKLRYFGPIMRTSESSLEKEIIQETLGGQRSRGGSKTSRIDNVKMVMEFQAERLLRTMEDRQ